MVILIICIMHIKTKYKEQTYYNHKKSSIILIKKQNIIAKQHIYYKQKCYIINKNFIFCIWYHIMSMIFISNCTFSNGFTLLFLTWCLNRRWYKLLMLLNNPEKWFRVKYFMLKDVNTDLKPIFHHIWDQIRPIYLGFNLFGTRSGI